MGVLIAARAPWLTLYLSCEVMSGSLRYLQSRLWWGWELGGGLRGELREVGRGLGVAGWVRVGSWVKCGGDGSWGGELDEVGRG